MEQASLAYLLWLIDCLPPVSPKANKLIECFGSADRIFFADPELLARSGILTGAEVKDLVGRRSLRNVEKIMDYCHKNEIRFLTLWDEDYPSRLKEIDAPPLLLFYKGQPVWREAVLNIAVAGTRKITRYAPGTIDHIVGDLAEVGCLIVGGMSEGVDACAHKSALVHGGKTLALLPGGVDVIYPQVNHNLYWEIVRDGCVMSQFLPKSRSVGSHFQPRNRLIAAISDGVLHVQSPEKSGSMITVKWATEYNRDVFAVPGDVDIEQSQGPNKLIQSGAHLVTGALDILNHYGYVFADAIAAREAVPEPVSQPAKIDEGTLGYEITQLLIERDADPSAMAQMLDVPLAELIMVLTDLRLKGIITEKPGGLYGLSKSHIL